MNQLQSIEDQLRSENESLRRQLEEQKQHGHAEKKPTAWTGLVVLLLLAALAVAGYYWGYVPRQKREMVLAAESQNQSDSLPVVTVTPVTRSASTDSLVLPGNIQAVTEAPVLARSSGYIKKRIADIGDRVTAGEVLAEIEAPELDQQILQAKAAVQQADAAMQQAEASLQQSRSNENLAHVTFDRFSKLADKGVISKQDNDTYRLQWAAQQSNVQALEKAVNAAKSNSSALEANVSRLNDLLAYLTVRAPFAGVITLRNVDTGVLVTEGATLLYRIAQTDRLRTYLNLPQIDADSVHVGQKAALIVPDLAGRKFIGTVTRTSNSLDPSTRTLLTEVQVENTGGVLMPGMYTQVDLAVPRKDPPLLVPGDTLVVRANGPQVAVVSGDGTVHFQLVQLGRDFGDRLEVLSGVHEGDQVVVNPSDSIREGAKVKPVSSKEKGTRS
ncbi:MAG: efflux RND transporter periplasmic adaptor subunit [Bryobacteraceae bacterium]|jgi:RND family efflux transporter MFP subunit